jgi:hypothetical protein
LEADALAEGDFTGVLLEELIGHKQKFGTDRYTENQSQKIKISNKAYLFSEEGEVKGFFFSFFDEEARSFLRIVGAAPFSVFSFTELLSPSP